MELNLNTITPSKTLYHRWRQDSETLRQATKCGTHSSIILIGLAAIGASWPREGTTAIFHNYHRQVGIICRINPLQEQSRALMLVQSVHWTLAEVQCIAQHTACTVRARLMNKRTGPRLSLVGPIGCNCRCAKCGQNQSYMTIGTLLRLCSTLQIVLKQTHEWLGADAPRRTNDDDGN